MQDEGDLRQPLPSFLDSPGRGSYNRLAAVCDDRDNVIHVTFRQDGTASRQGPQRGPNSGGRARAPLGDDSEKRNAQPSSDGELHPEGARPSSCSPIDGGFGRGGPSDPVGSLYSLPEAARVFGISESRLRYWARSGFIVPSGRSGRRRYYTFQDLIGLRVAKTLLDEGVPLRRVRESVDSLRASLPKVVRPLSELRVQADGQRVLVRQDEGAYEPTTGQLVLDFDVKQLQNDVVRILQPLTPSSETRQQAYELYLEGCRLDENAATSEDAEDCYRRALQLDPGLSNALTNLGNIRFRQGQTDESEQLYRQALEVDGSQPEAHYNLGFLAYERGELADAIPYFERALAEDPSFADAHFNLAMALEELGHSSRARPHWRTYVNLDPSGPWAEVARRYLS